MSNKIMTMEEYNNLKCEKNKWTGGCSKNTAWCFKNKFDTPDYGHLYNNAPSFICCYNHLKYLLHKMVKASKIFNFTFFLDFGTLLGCLRNEKIIPYDPDTDVGMLECEIPNFCNAINFLTNNDEKIKKINNLWYQYQLSEKNNIHLDIFIYKKKQNNKIIKYVGPEHYFLEEDLLPLKKAIMENNEVFIPNNSKKYIEKTYGEKCIENPISKINYHPDYLDFNSDYRKKGFNDLPNKNYWLKLLQNK